MKRSARETPMMRQYLSIKAQHADAIVFYRMGDFYEMFLHDAEVAAPLLDLVLTTRDKGKEDAVPMCGIPVHAADPHIKRLAELGHRVAICEQVEDANAAGGKRLVRREVVEVVTPGLVGDPDRIEAASSLCLAAIESGSSLGLATLDASTGEFRATQGDVDPEMGLPRAMIEELARVDPREVLISGNQPDLEAKLDAVLPSAARTLVEPASFDPARAPAHPQGFDPARDGAATRAAAALLAYLAENQPFALGQISRLCVYRLTDSMVLDAATCTHLELFRNTEDGSRARTLIARLDLSVTPLGARRLARWLAYPLLDPAMIAARQDAVTALVERDRPRAHLREALKPVRDIERLFAKSARPSSTPRDLAALRASLEALPDIVASLNDWDEELLPTDSTRSSDWPQLLPVPEPLTEIANLLREGLVDQPPVVAKGSRGANETGYIRTGFRPQLDALRSEIHKSHDWIAGFEAGERKRTGIAKLKIRYHPVHGYAIEVSKANLDRVPEDYERKQTLANAERFSTEALRSVEQSLRGGTVQAATLEREIFGELREAVLEQTESIREAAEAVAVLDASAALAEVARRDGWIRPVVDRDVTIEIHGGRHPVVEPLLASQRGEAFVPNDTNLSSSQTQLLVLTGPNMSGKSTYLRQVALITLLAQMGSYVPAESARIGVVDRVFTRVGASDRLARGESTFMVEMRETAAILAEASRRSLLILDEIGRGTSTFDGLSIAWAVAEFIHDTPDLGARTLFATHYHELADLARTKPRVSNAHFEAKEWGDDVIFLRRLCAGAASRSYGIQVARLAGLPASVIERARVILENLERGELDEVGRPRLVGNAAVAEPETGADQFTLFSSAAPRRDRSEEEALKLLRDVDPEGITPLEALQHLASIVSKLREEGES